jgi:hypothetical protein
MKRALLLVAVTWVHCANALNIQLDYSLDSTGFFAGNATAMAAVNAAALDLGNAILPSLGAVTTDMYSGTNGSTTATLDWGLTFTNPSTGAVVTLNTFAFAANTVRFYVGMTPLTGPTLGQGSPGASTIMLGSPGVIESQWVGAVAAAQASSNASMPRGGGPIINSLSGSATVGVTTANYTVTRGSMVGSLSFDNDTDNNGIADDATTLANFWQYDSTTAVAAGKNDMYSVALHELMHALGFSSSVTWDTLHAGTTWTGANVISLTGTGTNMLAGDQAHIVDGFMSTRVSDGVAQEAAMDPSLTAGTRKYLTAVDAAFLRDLGYQAVPEPGSAMLLVIGTGMFGARRCRHRS